MRRGPAVRATRVARTKTVFKSTWEEQYNAILEARLVAGEIQWFKYESLRFKLAEGAWLNLDFAVVAADGTFEMHEVKGQWREAARVRWKVVKETYPIVFKLVVKRGGQFVITEE